MDAERQALHRRFRWFSAAVLAALVVFGLTDVRRRARIDPADPTVHKTDLTIFTGAGAAFLADDEPYRRANPRGWKYAYPPLCALALAPLAALDSQSQAIVWYGLSLLMCRLAWREAVRIGRCLGWDVRLHPDNTTSHRVIAGLAAAAVALPTLNCLQRGQVGILYVWLLLWGARLLIEAADRGSAFVAGIVLALPGIIKVTPALPALAVVCGWSLMRFRGRKQHTRLARCSNPGPLTAPFGWLAGCGLFLFIVPAAFMGWEPNLRHLRTWTGSIAAMAVTVAADSSLETPYTVRNQSFSNAVYRFGNWLDYSFFGGPDDRAIDAVPFNPRHRLAMDAGWVSPVLLAVRLALLALLAMAGRRLCRPGDLHGLMSLFGLACVASLVVSPLSRGHYFVILLPAVLCTPLALRASRRTTLCLAAVPVALLFAHYVLLESSGRIGLLGLGLTAWYVAVAVGLLRRRVVPSEIAGATADLRRRAAVVTSQA